MAFYNSSHDRRHGVNRDSVNSITINTFAPLSRRSRSPHEVSPKVLSQGSVLDLVTKNRPPDAIFVLDTVVGIIAQIKSVLTGHDLDAELKNLYQTLTLSRLSVQAYDKSLLGQGLVNVITPVAKRSGDVLQELFDNIYGTFQGLRLTSIHELWPRVWRSRWNGDELASLRRELASCQTSLAGFLMALHSVSWQQTGNVLLTGNVTFKDFHPLLWSGPPPLYRIQLPSVQIVDHLGRIIPVPTLFCSAWKEFHYILRSYSKHRPGHHFIERGDYEVIRPEYFEVMNRWEFSDVVESGMTLEISIVMRERRNVGSINRCPRCGNSDITLVDNNGWIECRSCAGQFQIARVDQENQGGDESEDEEDIEEITSAASQATSSNTMTREEISDSQNAWQSEDDNVQLFRRLKVIVADNDAQFLRHITSIRANNVWDVWDTITAYSRSKYTAKKACSTFVRRSKQRRIGNAITFSKDRNITKSPFPVLSSKASSSSTVMMYSQDSKVAIDFSKDMAFMSMPEEPPSPLFLSIDLAPIEDLIHIPEEEPQACCLSVDLRPLDDLLPPIPEVSPQSRGFVVDLHDRY